MAMPKIQEKQTITKYLMIIMPLHQEKMILTPGSPNDNLNLSWTSSSSTSHSESSTNATPDKVHNSNNMATITVYP